jgi:glycosyltransferase involved in cell wall biosynthesis
MSNNSNEQMKIAIVSGASKKGDSVRGIGAHNSNLFGAFHKLKNKKIEIPEVGMNDSLSKYDVVHFTVFRPFFVSLPFFKPKNTKFVLTIHDLIMLVYPGHYPPGIKGKIKFLINKFLVLKYVDRIITITETSKKDICRFLGVDPQIVDVIYLAPKKEIKKLKTGDWKDEITKKYNLPQKFVLFDHGVNYNKNIPTLIKACRLAKIPLVVVGKEMENIGKLDLNHAELAHLKDVNFSDVLKLGYVSDEDLNKLFNLAHIYVQPSFYEGFGMPPLEAMTVECPVIASRTQALVEVCGDHVFIRSSQC